MRVWVGLGSPRLESVDGPPRPASGPLQGWTTARARALASIAQATARGQEPNRPSGDMMCGLLTSVKTNGKRCRLASDRACVHLTPVVYDLKISRCSWE